jgi:hypothetical protein
MQTQKEIVLLGSGLSQHESIPTASEFVDDKEVDNFVGRDLILQHLFICTQ